MQMERKKEELFLSKEL